MGSNVSGVGGSSAAYRAQAASSEGLSKSEATTLWNNLLNSSLSEKEDPDKASSKTNEKSMGSTYTKSYKERMTKDLETFLKDHPNATEKDVREFFSKQASKHMTFCKMAKSMDDTFMNKISAKAREAQEDRWK